MKSGQGSETHLGLAEDDVAVGVRRLVDLGVGDDHEDLDRVDRAR
jgi:hypothetical protein